MIAALLLAAAPPQIALEAETAFEHDARFGGQWTAFRKWAADDALLFVPQPVNAQAWLKGRKDPPQAVFWVPSKSFVSCDRDFAVNTGVSTSNAGKDHGWFTTVWRRRGGNWRWIYDYGDALPKPRVVNEMPFERVADCSGKPNGIAPGPAPAGATAATQSSADRTLVWTWQVMADGAHSFRAFLWNGAAYEQVVADGGTGR